MPYRLRTGLRGTRIAGKTVILSSTGSPYGLEPAVLPISLAGPQSYFSDAVFATTLSATTQRTAAMLSDIDAGITLADTAVAELSAYADAQVLATVTYSSAAIVSGGSGIDYFADVEVSFWLGATCTSPVWEEANGTSGAWNGEAGSSATWQGQQNVSSNWVQNGGFTGDWSSDTVTANTWTPAEYTSH